LTYDHVEALVEAANFAARQGSHMSMKNFRSRFRPFAHHRERLASPVTGRASILLALARAIVFASVLLTGASAAPADAGALLLRNAHIVDPARQVEFIGHVLIQDAKVAQVLRELPPGFDGEVVDLTGKYLIPGLVDAHVHSWGNLAPIGEPDEEFGVEGTARRMLYAGVTAFLDLGSDANTVFAAREKLGTHGAIGAELYTAGPVFIGLGRKGPNAGALSVETPEQARRELDQLALRHPDMIKLIFDWSGQRKTMSAEVMHALVGHARELGLKTVVHIGTWENARLAAEAGATVITHLDDVADIPEDLARLMAVKHVYSIPTMAVQQDFLDILEDHRILDSPLLRAVAGEASIGAYAGLDPMTFADCPTCRWQREGRKHYGVSLQRLARAGVPIVAGSDSGNLGTFQGFSLHRELVLLNQWGLTTWDALAAGTTRAYALLGLDMGFAPGADATFVVLSASPVANIAHTQAIERVLLHGEWVDRDALLVH
jgi:imidazolonepropionase-like amidohydrolase